MIDDWPDASEIAELRREDCERRGGHDLSSDPQDSPVCRHCGTDVEAEDEARAEEQP